MTNARMTEESEGVRAARALRRRWWLTGALSLIGALGVGAILTAGTTAPGQTLPGFAIATVIAMAIVLPLSVHFTYRASDEVEWTIGLRANSLGLYFYLFVQFCWMVLTSGGLVPPTDPMVMFLATALFTLGCYTVLKFAR